MIVQCLCAVIFIIICVSGSVYFHCCGTKREFGAIHNSPLKHQTLTCSEWKAVSLFTDKDARGMVLPYMHPAVTWISPDFMLTSNTKLNIPELSPSPSRLTSSISLYLFLSLSDLFPLHLHLLSRRQRRKFGKEAGRPWQTISPWKEESGTTTRGVTENCLYRLARARASLPEQCTTDIGGCNTQFLLYIFTQATPRCHTSHVTEFRRVRDGGGCGAPGERVEEHRGMEDKKRYKVVRRTTRREIFFLLNCSLLCLPMCCLFSWCS